MKVSPALCLVCRSFAERSHEWDTRSEGAADGRGGTLRLSTAGRGRAPSRPRTAAGQERPTAPPKPPRLNGIIAEYSLAAPRGSPAARQTAGLVWFGTAGRDSARLLGGGDAPGGGWRHRPALPTGHGRRLG